MLAVLEVMTSPIANSAKAFKFGLWAITSLVENHHANQSEMGELGACKGEYYIYIYIYLAAASVQRILPGALLAAISFQPGVQMAFGNFIVHVPRLIPSCVLQ